MQSICKKGYFAASNPILTPHQVQTIKMRTKQQTKTIKTPKCPWIPNRQTHAWVLSDFAWPVIAVSRGFGSWTVI
jgi:hypothetical protein